jgi:hypothetical protein
LMLAEECAVGGNHGNCRRSHRPAVLRAACAQPRKQRARVHAQVHARARAPRRETDTALNLLASTSRMIAGTSAIAPGLLDPRVLLPPPRECPRNESCSEHRLKERTLALPAFGWSAVPTRSSACSVGALCRRAPSADGGELQFDPPWWTPEKASSRCTTGRHEFRVRACALCEQHGYLRGVFGCTPVRRATVSSSAPSAPWVSL